MVLVTTTVGHAPRLRSSRAQHCGQRCQERTGEDAGAVEGDAAEVLHALLEQAADAALERRAARLKPSACSVLRSEGQTAGRRSWNNISCPADARCRGAVAMQTAAS